MAVPRGGLGNQLFNVMATLSVAQRHGWDVGVDLRHAAHAGPNGAHPIEALIPSQFRSSRLSLCEPVGSIRSAAHDARRRLSEEVPRLGPMVGAFSTTHLGYESALYDVGPGTRVSGYFQTFAYVQDLDRDELRTSLSLKSASAAWRTLHRELMDQEPVAIHVRRGDYSSSASFGILSLDYYAEAIRLLHVDLGDRPIWIFTDDPVGAGNDFPSAARVIGREITPAETLDLMSRSAGLAIANSSLSWWAAWLANETSPVVAPSPWFARQVVDVDALLPPRWTRLDASFVETP